jgi:hypothetical protein
VELFRLRIRFVGRANPDVVDIPMRLPSLDSCFGLFSGMRTPHGSRGGCSARAASLRVRG